MLITTFKDYYTYVFNSHKILNLLRTPTVKLHCYSTDKVVTKKLWREFTKNKLPLQDVGIHVLSFTVTQGKFSNLEYRAMPTSVLDTIHESHEGVMTTELFLQFLGMSREDILDALEASTKENTLN